MTTPERPTPTAAESPVVSVIIPAYGVNAYIAEAVDSVLTQTYTSYEIFVVNDGTGPEETAELKQILSRYGDRVRYVERENGGQAAARNTAMALSTAPFVAFLDGDDCWAPALLEREMALFARDPGLALVYADARLFGNHPWAGETYMQRDESVGDVSLAALLARRVNVTMSTIVARRDAVLAAGGYDESLRWVEDYDLWLRMAHRGERMAYIREPLAYRRLRPSSLSANTMKLERGTVEVLEQFGRTHQLSGTDRAAWSDAVATARSCLGLTLAKMSISDGNLDTAAEAIRVIRASDASWKLRAASVGLRAVPSVVGAVYRGWSWVLDARVRREAVRAQRRAARWPPAAGGAV